mmetsp:Transcript_21750/g.26195  ORF Transcript_21750/g.26195 Transcript_21750/m.26195 type:complete len:215 (-) Transcript_21750:153-797(-)
MRLNSRFFLFFACWLRYSESLSHCTTNRCSRQRLLQKAPIALVFFPTGAAYARPEDLQAIGLETPPVRESDTPFQVLPSGVKFKVLRNGIATSSEVTSSSIVLLEVTGRFLNLDGVKFYSSADNIDSSKLNMAEPLKVQLGTGLLVPGIEEGIIGAKKNEIRRIIVPASRGYDLGSKLEPWPTTTLGLNALNSVLKNERRDGTILFDVKIVNIK